MTNFLSSNSKEVKVLASCLIYWAEDTSIEHNKITYRIIIQLSLWDWGLNAPIYGRKYSEARSGS